MAYCYKQVQVKRIASFVIVGLLVLAASGAPALVTPERCFPGEASSAPDGNCLPLCARCGCCTQAVDVLIALPNTDVSPISTDVPTVPELQPLLNSREVFHVPKSSL